MIRTKLSKITCIADSRLSDIILSTLEDLRIPEVYVQGAKQMSLHEKNRFLGFGSEILLSEARSDIIKFFVPSEFEMGVADRVRDAVDLHIPGRGTLFAEDVELLRAEEKKFDLERLKALAVRNQIYSESYAIICCIVQRGLGETLARSVLDTGLCVPAVSFGQGMGLRSKLGLLRITVSVDKEIMYFAVPEREADFVSALAVRKARLDRPGMGFLYRYKTRLRAVNLRVRKTEKKHAASFDQVIAALDDLRGSSDWRKITQNAGFKNQSQDDKSFLIPSKCVSIYTNVDKAQEYVQAAMEAGAGGATLVRLSYHGFSGSDKSTLSHARETCDLVIPENIMNPVLKAVTEQGLFTEDAYGLAEISDVYYAKTYRA